MILHHQDNVAAFAGGHTYWWLPQQIVNGYISVTTAAVAVFDQRTVVGHVAIAFTSPGDFRVRTQRTGGSDDLQTVSGGSAITIEVIA